MTPESRGQNGNLWKLVLIIALTSYIGVKDVVAPLVSNLSGKQAGITKTLDDAKISQLEIVIAKLGMVSETVAAQSEAINGLKISVERLGTKIDKHIEGK